MANMDALKSTPHAMPDKTYKDKLTVGSGAGQIDLYYFGRAHTNGDTFVVFPALRTMHAGDVFGTKGNPYMDGTNGGSGLEYPKTVARVAKEIRNVDTVIPGHSPVTDWATFVEFGEFVQALVANVQESAKAGKTVQQATADIRLPEKFAGYTVVNPRLPGNVELIYKELGK
jgi:glyoxylase-like metal-dependent hydrolase (beta-lactamase superfamily II)